MAKLIVLNFMLTMVATDLFLYSSHRLIHFLVLLFHCVFSYYDFVLFSLHIRVCLFLWNRSDWNDKNDINESFGFWEICFFFLLILIAVATFPFSLPLRKYRKCMRHNVIAVEFFFRTWFEYFVNKSCYIKRERYSPTGWIISKERNKLFPVSASTWISLV